MFLCIVAVLDDTGGSSGVCGFDLSTVSEDCWLGSLPKLGGPDYYRLCVCGDCTASGAVGQYAV